MSATVPLLFGLILIPFFIIAVAITIILIVFFFHKKKSKKQSCVPAQEPVTPQQEEIRTPASKKAKPSVPVMVSADEPEDEDLVIPSRMPELDVSAPIPEGPKPSVPDPKAVEAAMKADKVTARDAAASAVEVAREIEENAQNQQQKFCFCLKY